MPIYAIEADEAPRAIGPYSQAVCSGDLVFCSGQIGLDPVSGQLVGPGDVILQTRQVMKNLRAVLRAAGCSFESVLKTTIYLQRIDDFGLVNEVYGEYLAAPAPARATVAVAGLPKEALVEIDAIARRPSP